MNRCLRICSPPIELGTVAGLWAVLAVTAILTSSCPAAAQVKTVDEVVVQALENPDLEGRQTASVDEARGRIRTAGQWPNPDVEYTREQGFSEPTLDEDLLEFSQRLPLSGRPGRKVEAYQRRTDAVREENADRRRRIVLAVRRSSYDMIADQRRLEAYDERLEALERLRDVMELRVERGESAPYELDRIERERADLVAEKERTEAGLERRRAELAGWLPSVESVRIDDTLPPGPPPEDDRIAESLRGHPSVQQLEYEEQAADLHRRALSRWWLPDIVVRAGMLRAPSDGESQFGAVAGAGLTLPIFDRRQGERQRLNAERTRTRHHRRQLERELVAEARGLATETRRLIETAEQYRDQGLQRAQRVRKTTRRAYEGDEATILELTEAHRGILDARLRHIDLVRQARHSEIELRYYLESMPSEPSIDEE